MTILGFGLIRFRWSRVVQIAFETLWLVRNLRAIQTAKTSELKGNAENWLKAIHNWWACFLSRFVAVNMPMDHGNIYEVVSQSYGFGFQQNGFFWWKFSMFFFLLWFLLSIFTFILQLLNSTFQKIFFSHQFSARIWLHGLLHLLKACWCIIQFDPDFANKNCVISSKFLLAKGVRLGMVWVKLMR